MKSMKGIVRKITASLLAVGIMGAGLEASTIVYAEKNDGSNGEEVLTEIVEEQSEVNDVYIAMDEEGNIELIPIEEMEPVDLEPLEGLEEVEYEVVVEEAGDIEVLEVVETLEEAEKIAEEVEDEIIEEQAIAEERAAEATDASEESSGENTVEDSMDGQDGSEETGDVETEGEGVTSSILSLFTIEAQATGGASVSVRTVPTDQAEVVVFKDRGSKTYTSYIEDGTGQEGYLHPQYAPDAAYLGESNGKVKFMQAGVIGWVESQYVEVYTYEDYTQKGKITSTYTTKNGNIYHNITTNGISHSASYIVGFQQSYMKDGATYYSYDGNYFYTDFNVMVADYKAGHHGNSINSSAPYYNYYQYLPHRTTTNFTASQINQYIAAKMDSSSKLYNLGSVFIENQNKFGTNAVLMLGVAINESAWGTSNLSQTKNNLFGHNAVDSNPYGSAKEFKSLEDSVAYHADVFVSQGYANPKDGRYHGSHLGNKESGMNVKYASDSYWGEKAAAHGFLMEIYFNKQVNDVGKYTIGITSSIVLAYTETDKKNSPYNTSDAGSKIVNNLPVVILETIHANGQDWYKVQSDAVLSSDRKTVNRSAGAYSFSRDYVYMETSCVRVAGTAIEVTPGGRGDTNGDGRVMANDYLMIMDYIMGKLKLDEDQIKSADVTGDGQVMANDYLMVMDYIMGKIQL